MRRGPQGSWFFLVEPPHQPPPTLWSGGGAEPPAARGGGAEPRGSLPTASAAVKRARRDPRAECESASARRGGRATVGGAVDRVGFEIRPPGFAPRALCRDGR